MDGTSQRAELELCGRGVVGANLDGDRVWWFPPFMVNVKQLVA